MRRYAQQATHCASAGRTPSRARTRAKPRRRKAGAGLPLVKLIEIGADDALQKRLRVEKHRDPEPIPIDLLHTLLKRDAGVGGAASSVASSTMAAATGGERAWCRAALPRNW